MSDRERARRPGGRSARVAAEVHQAVTDLISERGCSPEVAAQILEPCTDMGNALPADGLATFIDALRQKGFTDQELDRMAKQNPARLLGLE